MASPAQIHHINNLAWTRKLRELVTGDQSRAVTAWKTLTPIQRRIVLIAAGILPEYAHFEWKHFEQHERQAIKQGLIVLRNINSTFKTCFNADFK